MSKHLVSRQAARRFVTAVTAVTAIWAATPLSSASAQDAPKWIISEISGQARERGQDGAWHTLARGNVLEEGRAVETGPNATLVLMHGGDLVTVSPNSAFQIPKDPPLRTGIMQTLGTIMYHAAHVPNRLFEVNAPYLTAVVKGTVFTVSAGKTADSLHVAAGAVQVTSLFSRKVALIRPGEVAVVSSGGRDMTILGGSGVAEHALRGGDHADDSLGTNSSLADSSTQGHVHNIARLTRTVGEEHLDMAAITKGLIANGRAPNAPGHLFRGASTATPLLVQSGNPNAGGGNLNAGGGNPNAAGGNPNAGGANPNAGGGNPNAAGGNPNAGGGNPNAGGGNPNAGGANGHGKH